MRITFVSGGLGCGGAERVICSLSEILLRRGHTVSVVTLSNKEADFFPLAAGVKRVALDLIADNRPPFGRRAFSITQRLRELRRAILSTQSDVVISALQHINILTLLAMVGARCPVIVSEHLDPSMTSCGAPWDRLRRISYHRAAKLVSVSHGIDQHFAWLPNRKRTVIHNSLPVAMLDERAGSTKLLNGNANWIVAMGRLSHQKGFDLLLPAFASVIEKNVDWRLMVLGEGEQRPELERLIETLELNDRVTLPGRIESPFSILRHAKLFVLPSRYEGFGNVVIEAMACGLPVIAADCPSGPSEIVSHGENGLLVPTENVAALAAALERLMSNESERTQLGARAAESAKRFDVEKIADTWEEMLHQVVDEHSGHRNGKP